MRSMIPTSEARSSLHSMLEGIGKGNRYVLTKRGKPVAALVPIDDMRLSEVREKVEKRARLAGRKVVSVFPEAQAVILFGSCARGEPNSRSDVDLAVVYDHTSEEDYWRAWDAISYALGGLGVDLLVVSGQEWTEARPGSVLDNAKREGVVLHGSI